MTDLSPRATQQLAALPQSGALDTRREKALDELTELAAAICEAPSAVVNLLAEGRKFFKAEVGFVARATPLDTSFCAHAILEEDLLLVPDASMDLRFAGSPLVTGEPHIRFYAGAVLKSSDGLPIGTLCVLDYRPRMLTGVQEQALRVLGRQVVVQLERRLLDVQDRRTIKAERDRAVADLRASNETLEQRVAQRTADLGQAEDALRQSQKVEAIGQLTGGVAHDFNNLLTVIRGSVDLLRRPGLSEERRQRYIDAIADTADRATKLTNQLLAFARRQSLKPEVFDVTQSVRTISDMIRTLTGARVNTSLRQPSAPCYINADRSQFDRAIVNMAVNARDAMKGEGELTITVTTASEMPAMRTHQAVRGEFVTVSLTDSGPGISAENIDRIFEPFFTTKGIGEGTGLGLSQVFGFTKQSGGNVVVTSEAGQGATFTMYLPRVEDVPGATANGGDSSLPLGEGACVLVVEDNVEVGMFATQALAELGYKTVWAMDGQKALEELAAEDGRFDVVFSDVMMPGMSGIELGQEIGRRCPGLAVVLTSGYSEVLAQSGTHGFEFVHKPYSIDALSRALQKVSRRP
jgi:signal transduction histidine kinase/CheY-like chemotaxis protein